MAQVRQFGVTITISCVSGNSVLSRFAPFGAAERHGHNDDGTAKVKLIAGSLSKSYPFKIGDFEKALIENEGWVGYADKKY